MLICAATKLRVLVVWSQQNIKNRFLLPYKVKMQKCGVWSDACGGTSQASLDSSFVIIRPCVVLVRLVTFHLISNVGSIELLTSQSITLLDTAGPQRSRSTFLGGSTLMHDYFCRLFAETCCVCVKVLHEELSIFNWSTQSVCVHNMHNLGSRKSQVAPLMLTGVIKLQ